MKLSTLPQALLARAMTSNSRPAAESRTSPAAELNNLLQVIAGTSAQIENIWEGRDGAERYFAMLRASIERAEMVAAELVKQAGSSDDPAATLPAQHRVAAATPVLPLRPRILVVDDEPMAVALIQRVLAEAGYDVATARSGFQCLDLFGRTDARYDIVILDLAMPFMDGAETFDWLRAMSPNVRVILTTAFVEQTKLERMQARGLAAYLRKPYSTQEIVAVVESVQSAAEKRDGGIAAAH